MHILIHSSSLKKARNPPHGSFQQETERTRRNLSATDTAAGPEDAPSPCVVLTGMGHCIKVAEDHVVTFDGQMSGLETVTRTLPNAAGREWKPMLED